MLIPTLYELLWIFGTLPWWLWHKYNRQHNVCHVKWIAQSAPTMKSERICSFLLFPATFVFLLQRDMTSTFSSHFNNQDMHLNASTNRRVYLFLSLPIWHLSKPRGNIFKFSTKKGTQKEASMVQQLSCQGHLLLRLL